MQFVAHWIIFFVAACLEVGGDAVVRRGLHGGGGVVVAVGCAILGGYGLVVNATSLDFSKMLGVYVAVFAVLSTLAGKFYFGEVIPLATWLGLALIVAGALLIQFGFAGPAGSDG